ncbi:protein DELAY OF GERMINATION 1-like [Salvia miltiorrhiza]|uniref:protein DELAY OF GERMINATION 1-like n=1 Tax=Salvia miltiorrhiza TaxID=226208 RepID=UPI0025AC1FD8|nr:protein DELAY OF GERMINATION 1-like [Salvia miltiorrhiza]
MGKEEQENFQEFYTKWIGEQRQELGRLLLASKSSHSQTDSPLPLLVSRCVAHYEKYYKTKSKCAKTDALLLLSPPWISQLEDAFIWVGGWRPTAAFHLLYSKSGLQLEAKFSGVGAFGVGPLDLSDLTAEQLGLIDKLQRSTVAEERRISEKVAKQQESVADAEMVELSQTSRAEDDGEGIIGRRIKSAIRVKEEGFQKVLQSADDLRLGTLKAVVGILSPIQAVHFLIAAGELHLSLHEWGRDKDERDTMQQST